MVQLLKPDVGEFSAILLLPHQGTIARRPMGVPNLFVTYVIGTGRLSACDPGEARSRRLQETSSAYFTLALRIGRSLEASNPVATSTLRSTIGGPSAASFLSAGL
jgi:hypothetical protein